MPPEFSAMFASLRAVLNKHSAGMLVLTDGPSEYTLGTRAVLPNKRPMWFGCVRVGKAAVSYHLMPLYFNPKLQAAVPPALLPRLGGKTCFNFKRPDPDLFEMLDELTRLGREHFEKHGFLEPGALSRDRINAAARAAGADLPARRRATAKRRTGAAASRGGTCAKARSRTRGG